MTSRIPEDAEEPVRPLPAAGPADVRPETEPDDASTTPTSWADLKPWSGRAGRGDKLLVGFTLGITVFLLAMTPLKPFLIAHHPILLEFVTGSYAAIGAGAAYARIGAAPLWLVVLAGVVGSAKFDWLFWYMGRRWGARVVRLFAPSDSARRRVAKAEHLPRWVAPVAVIAAVLPGIPTGMVYAFAGWQRMRLGTFLLCNLLSSAAMVSLVAGLGFWAGQRAVDLVIKIDQNALWISMALIVLMAIWGSRRQQGRRPRS